MINLLAAAALGLGGLAGAVEVTPLYNVQVLGGQYFFRGERASLTGNAAASVTPGLKFNERWALLPSLSSSYQGTKQVVDLVGAGSLFQEQMDHRLAVKGVYQPSEDSLWRLKPSAGLRYQLLKETKDEDWTKGLFDYQKLGVGMEAEYVYRDPFTVRAGLDYYQVRFPNYRSLESEAASMGLARELAGDHVLDNGNVAATVAMDAPVWGDRVVVDGSLYLNYARFGEQRVVAATGDLIEPTREDLTTALSAGVKLPLEHRSDLRTVSSLSAGMTFNSSNQNSYDAQRTHFTPQYYNYNEFRVSPGFRLLVGHPRAPVSLGVAGHLWLRSYPHRVIQDSNGNYQTTALRSANWMSSVSLAYPMAPHFSLMFNVQHGRASSNQRFEQYYRYNYSVTNYLFGFTFEY